MASRFADANQRTRVVAAAATQVAVTPDATVVVTPRADAARGLDLASAR